MVQIIPCHFSWFFFLFWFVDVSLHLEEISLRFVPKFYLKGKIFHETESNHPTSPPPPPILPRPGKKFREKFFFISVGIVAIQHTDSMLPFVCMSILLHFRWIMTSKRHWCQSKCVYNSAYRLTFIQSFHCWLVFSRLDTASLSLHRLPCALFGSQTLAAGTSDFC